MPKTAIGTLSRATLVFVLAAFAVGACSDTKLDLPRKRRAGEIGRQTQSDQTQTIFGDGGLFGSSAKDAPTTQTGAGGGLAVNTYLWRATLDTVSFLPVSSADPFGGVIITDWYAPPETPNERFKLNVYVLGQALRADGVKVTVFRQVLDSMGTWRDARVEADTARQLEDAILTRARQLRNETRKLEN